MAALAAAAMPCFGLLASFSAHAAAATSKIVLTSSLNPSNYGDALTLTATVTGNSPTGSVLFKDGSTTLGSVTLSSGRATYSSSALKAGAHALTAGYAGDNNNAASSAALAQTINTRASTTALNSLPNPSNAGQNVTFTAIVTGASPSGVVTFKEGGATLGSATLNAGRATFSTSGLNAGSHAVTANYSGDGNHASSSRMLAHLVNATLTASSTKLSILPNPAKVGQPVTAQVSVSTAAKSSAKAAASGRVSVGDGITSCNVTLDATGAGSCTLTFASAGTRTLTATYSGDVTFAASNVAVSMVVLPVAAPSTVEPAPMLDRRALLLLAVGLCGLGVFARRYRAMK